MTHRHTSCEEDIINWSFPKLNSYYSMQPLNISFFHPFKVAWKKSVPKWKTQQNIKHLKKEDFPSVLKFGLDIMEEKNIVIKGFEASGICPFNPTAVDYDMLKKSKKKESPQICRIIQWIQLRLNNENSYNSSKIIV